MESSSESEKKNTQPDSEAEKEQEQTAAEANLERESKGEGGEETPAAEATSSEPSAEERLLYIQAEFENQKKRLLKEQDAAIKNANERLVRELMGIVDLFDRAMGSAEPLKQAEQPEVKNFLVGIEMTHREMVNLLGRFGVELVGQAGEPFNPERHEAISQVDADPESVGKVVQIVQRGCLLNGRLLEPAKVIVGKAKEGQ